MNTKYLFIELLISSGGYESSEKVLKKTKAKDIHKVGERLAKDWYDFVWDEEVDGYSDGCGTVVCCGSIREVSENDFDVLKKYLTVI